MQASLRFIRFSDWNEIIRQLGLPMQKKCWLRRSSARYYLSCITPFHKFGLRKLMASTPCRDGEFAKSSQTYAGTGTLR